MLALALAGTRIARTTTMRCLWPSAKVTILRKALAAAMPVAGLSVLVAWCAVTSPADLPHRTPLAQSEKSLRRIPAHISEFSPASAPLALPKCGHVRPPEALLTPDPLLHVQHGNLDVRVSFIVGSDGHVHSAFVLDSGGLDEDQIVLRTIRSWRYRPALCNGVPTDSEARVRFSIR
jgi:TonB family protein